ncbi:Bgt-20596 [Blumeria graminis f. sp. tritici]|uniref:Bgt-20596 n=2 Tax=Blumeria graminis f. sp. tritici TaxID=62690 RepID=A0A9X9MJ26_BLUGR|nr:Bgt-20596 [Blumeria graminis f. sp. tritici]
MCYPLVGEQKAHESKIKDSSALKKSRFRLVKNIVPSNLYCRIY